MTECTCPPATIPNPGFNHDPACPSYPRGTQEPQDPELQRISFRSSMSSENVIRYQLSTDLGADEVRRRLRGNLLDRLRTRRDMRDYKRWERKHDKARGR